MTRFIKQTLSLFFILQMSHANSLQVYTNLSYNPATLVVSQPLTIKNMCEHELAFKIKTNKKNLVSMNPCNGFIQPNTQISIPVKIVQNVPENVSVKLEVDWCLVTPEMKQKNDIKMATANEKDIYKKIFPIHRKQLKSAEQLALNTLIESKSVETYPQIRRAQKQENQITPFQYERRQADVKSEQIVHRIEQPKKQLEVSQNLIQEQTDVLGQISSGNNMMASLASPSKSLQIVSEEDEEDHEKEIETIRNQQVEQKRKIDEIKSKIRKLNQQLKSTQFIDSRLLLLVLVFSFLVGAFLQYLIF